MSDKGGWKLEPGKLLRLVVATTIAGLVVVSFVRAESESAGFLTKKYGLSRNSQGFEELIIRDFFNDKRGGVFVDVGAAHYKKNSNTYYLENTLGWSGLAIDPIREYAADYERFRPRTSFLPFFVSDSTGGFETLYIPGSNWWEASGVASWAKRSASSPREVQVSVSTLDDLLKTRNVTRIDFLSVDVELSEPKLLTGFSIDDFRPALVCIEAHPKVRQVILDYFARHGYVALGRYLRADELNLWFAPLAAAAGRSADHVGPAGPQAGS